MGNIENKTEARFIIRQKAEELHRIKESKCSSKLSEVETLKLIHELEVHEIELEMQKEELMFAKDEVENALQKYSELYDFAPTGYFTLTNSGKVLELNLAGCQLLQKERSKLKNSQFGFFVSDGSKPVFNQFLESVFRFNTKECCEVELLLDDTTTMNVYLTGILSENKEQVHITILDITQLKKTKSALRESEERYRDLLNNLDVGIIVHDKEGLTTY
ncbi:MAG: PAS domain-containing protein, partial [Flavobacterium sp.]|nr:PAS domain-containing protein [Flavobacterium sp.]